MHYTLRRADLERAHTEVLALAAALQAGLANAGSADGHQVLFARLSGPLALMFDRGCRPTSPSLEIPEASDVDDDDDELPSFSASPAGSSPPPAGSSLAGSPSPSPTRSSPPLSPSLNFDDEVPGALTLPRGTSEVDEEELPTLSRQYSDGTSEVDDEESPASPDDDVSSHAADGGADCSICQGPIVSRASVNCGAVGGDHAFCEACIVPWLKHKATCPLCIGKVSELHVGEDVRPVEPPEAEATEADLAALRDERMEERRRLREEEDRRLAEDERVEERAAAEGAAHVQQRQEAAARLPSPPPLVGRRRPEQSDGDEAEPEPKRQRAEDGGAASSSAAAAAWEPTGPDDCIPFTPTDADGMLSLIAAGGDEVYARAVKDSDMPPSVKAFAEAAPGAVVFASTSESLGIDNTRRLQMKSTQWGKQLAELMRKLPDGEILLTKYARKPGSQGKGYKYGWFVLTPDGLASLVELAGRTSLDELNRLAGTRSEHTRKDSIRQSAMKAFQAKGIHVCTTCTMPLLKATDPQFQAKAALIKEVTSVKNQLSDCGGYCCNCEA